MQRFGACTLSSALARNTGPSMVILFSLAETAEGRIDTHHYLVTLRHMTHCTLPHALRSRSVTRAKLRLWTKGP